MAKRGHASNNRKYTAKRNATTGSFFGEHSHRLPEAGEPMAYAMACVEVVANWSPRGRELYRELVKAWAAPGARAFYEQFMAEVPDEEVEKWKDGLRNPGLALLPDPNRPFRDLVEVSSSLGSVSGSEQVVKARDGAEGTPEVRDVATVVSLVLGFIIEGFNREKDLERGIVRVMPSTDYPWLPLMVEYRSALEHGGITPERLDRLYQVRQVKGKTVNFEDVMTQEAMSRLHRKVVADAKKLGLKQRHDSSFLDTAWVWYQCRVVHATVEDFLEAEWDNGDYSIDLKNLQKVVKVCDDVVGYRKRLARPSR